MPGGVWPVSLYVFTGAGCNLYMTRSGQQNTLRDKSVCLILRAQEHIVQDALRTAPNQPVDLRNPANADRFRRSPSASRPDAGVTSTFYVGMAPARARAPRCSTRCPTCCSWTSTSCPPGCAARPRPSATS